jgi:multimeric flavodoxin WrbA
MKILVLQGSFRMEKGLTDTILKCFMQGIRCAVNDVEIDSVYLADKVILSCRGCLNCWTSLEGRCSLNDDMVEIVEKFREADVVIAATPIYMDGMSSYMKRVWERFFPLLSPYFQKGTYKTRHMTRIDKGKGLFLLSVAALPENMQFDPIIMSFERIAYNFQMEYLGHLVRPEVHSLTLRKKFNEKIDHVLGSIKECGKEFGTFLKISEETLEKAQSPIVDSIDDFIDMNNKMWDRVIEQENTKNK